MLANGCKPPDLTNDLHDLAINCCQVGLVKSSNLEAAKQIMRAGPKR